ncbi:MAG: hypothetical protein U5J64_07955 [Halobacteriales archaeon]|nr:hypothetical protein [Halobacteriales archaeon]
MAKDWEIIETVEVRSNDSVKLPDKVRKMVSTQNDLMGEIVYWHYEKGGEVATIANDKLQKPSYTFLKATRVYDGPSIRPPSELMQKLTYDFEEGENVVYLAYSEMSEGDYRSAFLLSEEKAWELLPQDEGDGDDDLISAIMNTPGFI